MEGKAKWIKTARVYSMGFKVPTHREEIGDPLDKCSVNCDISPNLPLFRKGGKDVRLVRREKFCELNPENRAFGRSDYEI